VSSCEDNHSYWPYSSHLHALSQSEPIPLQLETSGHLTDPCMGLFMGFPNQLSEGKIKSTYSLSWWQGGVNCYWYGEQTSWLNQISFTMPSSICWSQDSFSPFQDNLELA